MDGLKTTMIVPKEILDLHPNPDDYLEEMSNFYIEGLTKRAVDDGIELGEVQRRDYGICSKEYVKELNKEMGYGEDHNCEAGS